MPLRKWPIVGPWLVRRVHLLRARRGTHNVLLGPEKSGVVIAWARQRTVAVVERIHPLSCRLKAELTLLHLQTDRAQREWSIVSVLHHDNPRRRSRIRLTRGVDHHPLLVDPLPVFHSVKPQQVSRETDRLWRLTL